MSFFHLFKFRRKCAVPEPMVQVKAAQQENEMIVSPDFEVRLSGEWIKTPLPADRVAFSAQSTNRSCNIAVYHLADKLSVAQRQFAFAELFRLRIEADAKATGKGRIFDHTSSFDGTTWFAKYSIFHPAATRYAHCILLGNERKIVTLYLELCNETEAAFQKSVEEISQTFTLRNEEG